MLPGSGGTKMAHRSTSGNLVLALAGLLAACDSAPGGDAPPTATSAVLGRSASPSVSASASSGTLTVHEGPTTELQGRDLQYPTDGVLELVQQDVSILPATLDAGVRAAFCAELGATNASLRCGKEPKDGGASITVTAAGNSVGLRGQLLVRTGIGQDLAYGLDASYDGSADLPRLAREAARRWLERYAEGLARRTHAPPKSVIAVSRGDTRGITDRARLVLGDGVYEFTTGTEELAQNSTFFVFGVTALTPGRASQRTPLIDETPSMHAPTFALRDAVAWDPAGRRVLAVRGRSGPAADKTIPGGACKDESDCAGLTLLALDEAARATVLTSLADLTVQSGPVVVGDDVYVLGAQGKQMFVLRFHGAAPPDRTKIDIPVTLGTAMRLLPLGTDALGAVAYDNRAIHRFSVKKGKVGAVKTIKIESSGSATRLVLDGHGGLVAVSPGKPSTATCQLVALDPTGVERFRIEVPEVASTCPTPEVAGDVISLPKVGWFAWKDGKPAGAKGYEGKSLTRVGDGFVACTATGIGSWAADGTARTSVDLPGGCAEIGVTSTNHVLVVALSAGAYDMSPPASW